MTKHDETKLPKWAQKELGVQRALVAYWKRKADNYEAVYNKTVDKRQPSGAD